MPRHAAFVPHGVIAAVLLPFHEDFSIDEANFRAHLRLACEASSTIPSRLHSATISRPNGLNPPHSGPRGSV